MTVLCTQRNLLSKSFTHFTNLWYIQILLTLAMNSYSKQFTNSHESSEIIALTWLMRYLQRYCFILGLLPLEMNTRQFIKDNESSESNDIFKSSWWDILEILLLLQKIQKSDPKQFIDNDKISESNDYPNRWALTQELFCLHSS